MAALEAGVKVFPQAVMELSAAIEPPVDYPYERVAGA